MRVDQKELIDLGKAWIAVSLAFAILFSGGMIFTTGFLLLFGISALTVGLGFLLHELAHKYMAERYKFHERFIADDRMLVIMIIISFFGFVFAAPGGVYIQGHLSTEKHGKVALAGPLTNIVLALFFLPMQFSGTGLVAMIGGYGFFINCWLAIFNLIPFGPLDGRKVFKWNPFVWGVTIAVAGALMIIF